MEENIGPDVRYWYERHLFAYLTAIEASTADGPAVVVEFGCGQGYALSRLAAIAGCVVGLDRDRPSLERAKVTATSASTVQADVTAVPLSDACADLVLSFQVIEHLDDVGLYLQEIRRVLRRDGQLWLTTPNIERSSNGIEQRSPFHVHEYAWDELGDVLRMYFTEVDITGIDLRPGTQIARSDSVVRRAQRADPLRLRRLVPRRLRAAVLSAAGYVPPADADVGIEDFVRSTKPSDRTVDLLAVARKGA